MHMAMIVRLMQNRMRYLIIIFDQMMTIPLDPTMTAKENAQKYFEL